MPDILNILKKGIRTLRHTQNNTHNVKAIAYRTIRRYPPLRYVDIRHNLNVLQTNINTWQHPDAN